MRVGAGKGVGVGLKVVLWESPTGWFPSLWGQVSNQVKVARVVGA